MAKNDEIKTKSQFIKTATQPQCNRTFCHLIRTSTVYNVHAVTFPHYLSFRLKWHITGTVQTARKSISRNIIVQSYKL